MLALLLIIINSCVFYAQGPSRNSYLLIEFGGIEFPVISGVIEKVVDAPFTYHSKAGITQSLSVSWMKQGKDLDFGFGISTISNRQEFSLEYTLPQTQWNDEIQSLRYQFYRHKLGLHGLLVLKQNKLSVGIRLGVYGNMLQNTCRADRNVFFVVNNSNLGTKRTEILEKCYQGDRGIYQAISHFDLMYSIGKNFFIGGGLTYLRWRKKLEYRYLKFEMYQDLEWTDGSEEVPKVNDILVIEPTLTFHLKLRYLINLRHPDIKEPE